MLQTILSLLSSSPSFLKPQSVPGDSDDNPLQTYAVPGLMTLLDSALLKSVEGELTATLTTSHTLLAAWLDLRKQSILVLQLINNNNNESESCYSNNENNITISYQRMNQIESFARACLEAACDAVERMTTEKLAQSANLSDPYESLSSSSSAGVGGGVSMIGGPSHHHHHHHGGGSSASVLTQSIENSTQDTGRRRWPIVQRSRDCWESPRLHCPDSVWCDDVAQCCQRLLRHLYKHAFITDTVAAANPATLLDSNTSTAAAAAAAFAVAGGGSGGGTGVGPDSNNRFYCSKIERAANVLFLLIQTDIPTRLVQFRTACEADSVVSKRLYLVKCEYRAPFRAFLESHHSVLRAPTLELLDEYLAIGGGSSTSSSNSRNVNIIKNNRRDKASQHLQKLVENKNFVEALALEQRCEEYEQEMAKALFPFCEFARFLEHKRARLKVIPNILNEDLLLDVQETVRRLKGLLCRKTGPDTSTGIRPLLLDLQGIPRDEDVRLSSSTTSTTTRDDETLSSFDEESFLRRLEGFITELKVLGKLCETRNAFNLERKGDVDLPSSIVRGCTQFDAELFSCRLQDFHAMVTRQHELTSETNFEELAEKLRRAEMQMSLAVAPHASLTVVRERVETITSDRSKRFEVLKEMVEECCLREMNLHVRLIAPDKGKPLSLQPTSAIGVFGIPLLIASESLPIG